LFHSLVVVNAYVLTPAIAFGLAQFSVLVFVLWVLNLFIVRCCDPCIGDVGVVGIGIAQHDSFLGLLIVLRVGTDFLFVAVNHGKLLFFLDRVICHMPFMALHLYRPEKHFF
jgi:hypothetical protein